MEKDILIQNLRTRIGEDNASIISDKTFEGIADAYLPMFADDSKITDDMWNYPVAVLNAYAGQKRHDDKVFAQKFKTDYAAQHQKDVDERIKEATEKAIEEYKKSLESAGGSKEGDGDGDGGARQHADDMDERIKAILGNTLKERDDELAKLRKTIEDITASQKEREKTAQKNSVKTALKQHLQSLKANNEACIDDALDDIDYGDNPVFDELKQTAVAAYEKRYKRYYSDGGKPFGGESAGGGEGGTGSIVKSHIERVKQQVQDAEDYAKETEARFAK
jgi:hypothetical protein